MTSENPSPTSNRWSKLVHPFFTYSSLFISKRSLARLLSTFLCSLAIVIRPFSRLGGNYAFLILALKELVFSVQDNLAQQLELTVLNTMGALIGIGVSTLAKYIASLCPPGSSSGRATCAVFLILIAFFAGLTKSRLPRLTLSTRISCFVSVWILTADIGVSSRVLPDSGNFLCVALTAAILCLISLFGIMVVIRWATTSFEYEIASTFSLLQECLSIAMTLTFNSQPDSPKLDGERERFRKLHADLLKRSIKLNETYSQAAFELRIGRLSLRSIRPLIEIIEHLRRELAWGLSLSPSLHTSINHRPHPHDFHLNTPLTPRSTVTANTTTTTSPTRDAFSTAIGSPALSLGQSIVNSMRCVESTIILAFHRKGSLPPHLPSSSSSPSSSIPTTYNPVPITSTSRPPNIPLKWNDPMWIHTQLLAIHTAEVELLAARDEARELLKAIFEDVHVEEHVIPSVHQVTFEKKEVFKGSLAMIALLQMAQEMLHALQMAHHLACLYNESQSRLWIPHISLAWLGVPPGPFISDDPSAAQLSVNKTQDEDDLATTSASLSLSERRQGLAEHAVRLTSGGITSKSRLFTFDNEGEKGRGKDRKRWRFPNCWTPSGLWTHWTMLVDRVWSNEKMLKFRVKLWKLHREVKHSSHLKHAIKNAVGVAILTFPAFMPVDSAGRRWYSSVHGQWMTISYLWVLETNTGATWRTGYLRILGTILGAVYAYITALICHTNAYGLVVLVTAADVPITWLIMRANLAPLAVPASVAIPPIVFAKYIVPDTHDAVFKLALLRALMISAGMLAAILMNSLVFPRHCRVLFLSDTSRTIGLLSDLYLTLSHEMFSVRHAFARDERRKTLKLELQTRNELFRLTMLISTMKNEFGLLPKPLGHYRRVVIVIQKILDLLTGLRKTRENIPRKEAVADVFRERREFMSCVCITLFACQHAFRTREPLPQFLPSARHAFFALEAHLHECLRQAKEQDPHAMGLSLVYAFAEQEIIRRLVDTLEDLLELTGRLFGTSAWLMQDSSAWSAPGTPDEGNHGWYSTFKLEEAV